MSYPKIDALMFGHTSEETAYLVEDYPYGFRLRCKVRYWIETHPKLGDRFCKQTTNPKVRGEVWNKPKKSTYYMLMIMYKGAETGHVEHMTIHPWEEKNFPAQMDFLIPIIDKLNRHQILSIRMWYYMNTQVNFSYRQKHYSPALLQAFTDWTKATLTHIAKCEFADLLRHPQAPRRDIMEDERGDRDFYIGIAPELRPN